MGIYVKRQPERYWLVESHREGRRVVQTHLKYLGTKPPTLEELAKLKEEFKDRVPPKSGNGRRKPEKGKKGEK
jgi:hypothetical protein